MVILFSILIIFCAIVSVMDWRYGVYACVVAALIQDPLRKLIPEQPVSFTFLVAAVFALAFCRAYLCGINLSPRQTIGWNRGLRTSLFTLLSWIFLQTIHSLVAYDNPAVTAVGLGSYIAPLPVVLLSYQFAMHKGIRGIETWLKFYFVVTALALVSIVLEYGGVNLAYFGQLKSELLIYDLGTVLIGKTGIFRSTEIAAWHAMAAACIGFIILTSSKINSRRIILAVGIAICMILIAVLTGRRKTILGITIFATTYLFILAVFYKQVQNWLFASLAAAATIFLIAIGTSDTYAPAEQNRIFASGEQDRVSDYQLFLERGVTVFEAAPDRLEKMSVGQAKWAAEVTGLFGAGVGVATSGARHVGNVGRKFGGIGEGGIGKIMAELGIPGLILLCWFGFALVRHLWRILRFAAQTSAQILRLSAGLTAFLVANGAVFFVNTQIFNDLFVLIACALTTGFVFALPALAKRNAYVGQTSLRHTPLRPYVRI